MYKPVQDYNEGESPASAAPIYKIALIGAGLVGKTTLIERYVALCHHAFSHVTQSAEMRATFLHWGTPLRQIVLWDVTGRSRYSRLREEVLSGTYAVALVYDVTSPASFFDLMHWREAILGILPGVAMTVVGNKTDLGAVIPVEEARGWAEAQGMGFTLTSALRGDGVKDAFDQLIEQSIQAYQRRGR